MRPASSVLVALLVVAAAVGAVALVATDPAPPDAPDVTAPGTFDSAADFDAYRSAALDRYGSGYAGISPVGFTVTVADSAAVGAPEASAPTATGRVSGTNVQVPGIDEPDIVKTDGEYAYVSPGDWNRYYRPDVAPETSVLSLRPPEDANRIASIDDSGRLLRVDDTLVVIGANAVTGYSVADPSTPERTWTHALDGRVVAGRLADGQVYLVIASGIPQRPCPVEPMAGVATPCTEVYHPGALVPVQATYSVVRLDPATGETGDSVSFVGSHDSTVYMSNESAYVTTTSPPARGQVMLEFLLSDATDVLPEKDVAHLREVRQANLSDAALAAEANHVLDRFYATLSEDRRRAVHERLADRYREYTADHLREFTTTHVMKVSVPDLAVEASGSVPGRPLNQFAMDEHDGHLRIATTVSAPRVRWQGANTSNDVYVLDDALARTGSVQGMSDGQRVYAVRFVGDTGYVVTFRQVDPLHVLDLSDPQHPVERGALKLPGFSRYLHPLSEDRLLGIGEEDGQVKAVVFDVSTPTDPTVEASRVLPARYSAIERTHHAFLQDPRHDVFFLPTERGGEILSTTDLSTRASVSLRDPRRAFYVDDSLYVVGGERVVVLNETTWDRVGTVPLR